MAVTDYLTAAAFLHTRGKPVPRKKFANNTYLERRDEGTIALVLHTTDVVTFHRHSPYRTSLVADIPAVTLNTGGWLTVTTKDRINSVLESLRVESNKGTWEVRNWRTQDIVRYTDGITFESPLPGIWQPVERTLLPGEDQARQDRHNTSTRRLVNRYITGLTDERLKAALSYGQNPDTCVMCRPQSYEPIIPGSDRMRVITIGDAFQDTQHLLEHMAEGEYPFQLLYAAVAERGYNAEVVIGHRDITKRSLRTYLSNRLYVGATAPAHGKRPVLAGTS